MKFTELYSKLTEFNVESDDFKALEIRQTDDGSGFCYFYNTGSRSLVTDFVLEDRKLVATLCRVTLIHKEDRYSPRLRFWKKDKTKVNKVLENKVGEDEVTKIIKASVDTGDCYRNFWKLIKFIESFESIDIPGEVLRVVSGDSADIAKSLEGQDKDAVVQAVQTVLGSELTETDLAVLANRKAQLKLFEDLLTNDAFFTDYIEKNSIRGREVVWQHFFEANQWIFGYGLNLVSCESLSHEKLEQITTGANIFTGAGKRSDGVLRSRGYISSLLFAEIKHHETDLLKSTAYRKPDVYQVSDEISGAVSQLQKTADKAVRGITENLRRHYEADGTPSGVEYSLTRPKQVLVAGRLTEFNTGAGVNPEMHSSFELYRRSLADIELITFDELLERCRFIVSDEA